MTILDSLIAWKIPRLARWKVISICDSGCTHELPKVRFCIRRSATRWAHEANQTWAEYPIRFTVLALKR